MAKPLSLIGGILALLGTAGSIFINLAGWYMTPTQWTSAIGAVNANGTAIGGLTFIASPLDIMGLLPGALALIGAILCFIPKTGTCLIGAILILGGIGVFIFLGVGMANIWTASGNIGYGAMATALGGLLGLIGAFGGKKK